MNASPSRLQLQGITKRYPSVVANENIDLTVMPGEIHAILGENGAGKSTLVKTIYGSVQPDEGRIWWNSKPVQIKTPAQARSLGIGMVFQHFSLFDTLTVAENISLALSDKRNPRQLAKQIREVSEHYGLPIQPDQLIHDLSVGERQRVEIVRCLLQKPQLLIMDEPTSVLTPQAVQKLFKTLRRLADDGCSILYISHKLDEIRELCHRATVLRGGKVTGTTDPSIESNKSLAEMMIGSELPVFEAREGRASQVPQLQINQLSRQASNPFGVDLKDINLTLFKGEILGIAGVSGNGQNELLNAISGESLGRSADEVHVLGTAAGKLGPAQRRTLGMRMVPEERLGRGAVPGLSLQMNALLTGYDDGLTSGGFIRHGKTRSFTQDCIEQFNVKCAGPDAVAKSLSGGNVQKFIVGRELLLSPKLLVISQPTWGVDVGAASFIRQTLLDLCEEGVSILLISEELDELFEVCDRIAVIAEGHISDAFPVAETSIEQIGLLMGGSQTDSTSAEQKEVERV